MTQISSDPAILAKAARVKLLLMDVDGVLTNGIIYHLPSPDGTLFETKGFDSQDGIALQWLNWYGIDTGVISGRDSAATRERARQGKMRYCYQGHIEKIPILEEIIADCAAAKEEIAYIGDDFTDVVLMNRVGLSFAVANARPEVKRCATVTLQQAGGNGALREAAELILRAKGYWTSILEKYEIPAIDSTTAG